VRLPCRTLSATTQGLGDAEPAEAQVVGDDLPLATRSNPHPPGPSIEPLPPFWAKQKNPSVGPLGSRGESDPEFPRTRLPFFHEIGRRESSIPLPGIQLIKDGPMRCNPCAEDALRIIESGAIDRAQSGGGFGLRVGTMIAARDRNPGERRQALSTVERATANETGALLG
jgi:hypothetical protein